MVLLTVRVLIRRTPFYRLTSRFWQAREQKKWNGSEKNGPPPGSLKRQTIICFLKERPYSTMIETGTYLGDTTYVTKDLVDQLYSIELDDYLSRQATKRFAKDHHVHIVQGSSSKVLPQILSEAKGPILFWLDAHYSGGATARGDKYTPIVQELDFIRGKASDGSLILIDDARLFDGTDDYPTMDIMKKIVADWFPVHHFEVKEDIIRIVPAN